MYSSLKQPYISKILDISTGHITENDNDLLGKEDCPVVAYPYGPEEDQYGYLVCVKMDEEAFQTEVILSKEYGFSESFIKIYKAAHAHGIEYVRFDRDGVEYEDIPIYNW